MATKDEIVAGLTGVIERLNRMALGIEAHPETPLPEGTWTVRDCLAHIAADGNAVPRWQSRVEGIIRNETSLRTAAITDAENEEAIHKRAGLTMAQLIEEARAGRKADIERLAAVDESLLQHEVPRRDGGMWPASELLSFFTAGHDNIHLDDIEKALGA